MRTIRRLIDKNVPFLSPTADIIRSLNNSYKCCFIAITLYYGILPLRMFPFPTCT